MDMSFTYTLLCPVGYFLLCLQVVVNEKGKDFIGLVLAFKLLHSYKKHLPLLSGTLSFLLEIRESV